MICFMGMIYYLLKFSLNYFAFMRCFLFFIFFPIVATAQPGNNIDSLLSIHSLQESVAFLAGDDLKGRLTGSEGAITAAHFIAAKFKAAGLESLPGQDNYLDTFLINRRKKINGLNVIAALPGEPGNDTTVIFSAHYDHLGKGNDLEYNKDYRRDDEIYNGANDNATGVAALLELAKYFSVQKNNRPRLLFVAFAGEEMGLLGSTAYVKKINTSMVKAVINIEMLGRPANNNCYIVSVGNSKLVKILNNSLTNHETADQRFFGSDPYFDENLGQRSDHYPFTRKIKNAFTVMASSPADEFYHTVDDEYNTIDFQFVLKATRNIALASEYFIK
jgi:Zn-dependent M28 family amino/carboxypeptidase